MKPFTRLLLLVACASCGPDIDEPDLSEYHIVSSSTLGILDAGSLPPAGCTKLGALAIPQRDPGLFARHFGFAEEEFFQSIFAQIQLLKANLVVAPDNGSGHIKPLKANFVVVADEGSSELAAASSGQAFRGTAYSCP